MKKLNTVLLLLLGVLANTTLFGQKVEGYETVYYHDSEVIEETEYKLSGINAVSRAEYCKLGLKIMNESADFLMYKMDESKMKFEFGDKELKDKVVFIRPGDGVTRTLKADGGTDFQQKSFSVHVDGIYRIPADGTPAQVEDFKLPASQNNMTGGNFKIKLLNSKALTKETWATFEVTYTGDDVAIVDASAISIKTTTESGEEVTYANDFKNLAIDLLSKGESVKVRTAFHIPAKVADMQFATMYVVWNNSLVESKPLKLGGHDLEFKMDEKLTQEKK